MPIAGAPLVVTMVVATLLQAALPTAGSNGSSKTQVPSRVVYSRAQPVTYVADLPAFVTRSGTALTLGGKPYRFVGLNIYNANNLGSCWYPLGTPTTMNQTLTAIGPGQNAFRAWFFQPMAFRNGELDWSAFDATLAAARAHDERVIATLGNQYPDCERGGSANRTEDWYRTGYAASVDAGMPFTYREWVVQVINRYRDNPTILAWQLMNEAADPSVNGRCSRTASRTLKGFAQDVAGMIKRIDANHLVSLGTLGVRECGTIGAEYEDVHSVPGVDVCEIHDYGTSSNLLASALPLRIQQCRALNKPLFIGEMGLAGTPTGERAGMLQTKLAAAFRAGASGVLVWDWANADIAPYSGYEIQPGDPALQVMASAL